MLNIFKNSMILDVETFLNSTYSDKLDNAIDRLLYDIFMIDQKIPE